MAQFLLRTTVGWILVVLFVLGMAGTASDVLDWQDRFDAAWWQWALFGSLALNAYLLRELRTTRQALESSRDKPRDLVTRLIAQADSLIDADVGGPVGATQLLAQAQGWRDEASLQIRSELGPDQWIRFERGVEPFREYEFNVPGGGHGTQIEATKLILRHLRRNLEDIRDAASGASAGAHASKGLG